MDLIDAAKKGQMDEVRRFLAAGADVNAADESGRTALNWARAAGHTDVVRALRAARGATPQGMITKVVIVGAAVFGVMLGVALLGGLLKARGVIHDIDEVWGFIGGILGIFFGLCFLFRFGGAGGNRPRRKMTFNEWAAMHPGERREEYWSNPDNFR